MKDGTPFNPADSMRSLSAVEHILIGSTHVDGSNLEAIQAQFDSSDTGARRAARQLALIPLQVVDHINAIPDELYEEINNSRRGRYLEGGIVVISAQMDSQRRFVSPRLWLTEMTDRRTGMTPNTWQVQATVDTYDATIVVSDELDNFTIIGPAQNNFVLHPRQPENDFRVLEMVMS